MVLAVVLMSTRQASAARLLFQLDCATSLSWICPVSGRDDVLAECTLGPSFFQNLRNALASSSLRLPCGSVSARARDHVQTAEPLETCAARKRSSCKRCV